MIGLFCVLLFSGNIGDYHIATDFSDINDENHVEEMRGNSFILMRCVPNKFQREKIFERYDELVVVTDGVILNREKLEAERKQSVWKSIVQSYRSNQLDELIRDFRGSFSGLIVDEKKTKLTIYNDQLASKPLFYYTFNNGVVIASEVKTIVDFCRRNGLPLNLSMAGAYSMLTYGYMYQDNTLVAEIKRLREGNIYSFSDAGKEMRSYHEFSTIKEESINIPEDEIIDTINRLFREGLSLEIEKNKQYGYEDAIPLSAGMDCRMTAYVYRDLYQKHSINFTYSEIGEYDFTIPSKMAHDLKNRWIFKSLDHGLDLYNIEESIRIADGLIYYAWPAQLIDFLRCVDTKEWGIIHTGVLGDIIIDSFTKYGNSKPYQIGDGAFSLRLIDKLTRYVPEAQGMHEHEMVRNRGINGACLGYSLTFRHFAEDISPFLYCDLFDYCFSLPLKIRQRHKLYYAWVRKYYPQALKYKHNGITPKGKWEIKLKGKSYRIRAIPDIIKNMLRIRLNPNYGMNPLDGWYQENEELKRIMDGYFDKRIEVVNRWPELYQDAKALYQSGNTKEKIQAISLAGSVKMFFGEG